MQDENSIKKEWKARRIVYEKGSENRVEKLIRKRAKTKLSNL